MRILVADGSEVFVERLTSSLAEVTGIEIVVHADNVPDAVQEIRKVKPDVVILDIRMLGGSGIDVLEALKEDQFKPIVIVLSNYSSRQYRRKCLQSGARFFFDKSAEFHKVAEVLRSLTGILVDFAQAGAAALDVEMTQHRGRAVPALVVDSAGGEHWDEPLSGFDRIEVSVASGD